MYCQRWGTAEVNNTCPKCGSIAVAPEAVVDKNWDAEMKPPPSLFSLAPAKPPRGVVVDALCPICSGKDRVDCAQKLGDHVSDYEWNYAEIGIGRRNLHWPHDF